MSETARSNYRLYPVWTTRRFVTGLAAMKGLGEVYAEELSFLETLWAKARTSCEPQVISSAREFEARLLRSISHS